MHRARRALFLALTLASAAPVVGCGGVQTGTGAEAPRWEGALQQAFPDDIDPAALGLPATGPRPSSDPALRQRTLLADVVARARVQTVSVERRSNGEPVFRVGLELASPPLVERAALGDRVEVAIEPGGAAHGLARAFDVRLQGKTFVAFLRRFAGEDGETVLHFHLARDGEDVGAAVQQIVALEEVSGS
jgi:hypothetical protein